MGTIMRTLISLICVLLSLTVAEARVTTVVVGQPLSTSSETVFTCGGSELFCADFETNGMISWTGTPAAEDCDGYDADQDWCDYDATSPAPLKGTHSFGLRGTSSTNANKSIASSVSEFYIEFTVRITSTASGYLPIRVLSSSTNMASVYNNAGTLRVHHGTSYTNTSFTTFSNNTTYHMGVYYKAQTGSGTTDGIARFWINTSGDFVVGDLKLSVTNGNFGYGLATTIMRIYGIETGQTVYVDNVRIVSGAPSWPTS